MASIKISELEEVTKLSTSDVLPIINENKTKKVSLEKLNEILGGSGESGSGSAKMLVIEFDNNLKTFDTDTNKAILTEYYNSIRNNEFVELFIAFNKFSGAESGDNSYWYRASVMELDDYYLKLYCPPYINTNQSQNIYGVNYHEMRELEVTASVQISDENYSIVSISHYYNNSWSLNGNNKILGINNVTAFTPTGDYNPATKKYVDDAIANIDIPEGGGGSGSTANEDSGIFAIDLSGSRPTNSTSALADTVVDKMVAAFKNNKDKGLGYPAFLMRYSDGPVLFVYRTSNYTTNLYKTLQYIGEYVTYSKRNARTVYTFSVNVRGFGYSSTTEVDIEDAVRISRYKEDNSLNIDNTEEYTPTADYHPSTKKYVDDSIKSAITSALEAEY